MRGLARLGTAAMIVLFLAACGSDHTRYDIEAVGGLPDADPTAFACYEQEDGSALVSVADESVRLYRLEPGAVVAQQLGADLSGLQLSPMRLVVDPGHVQPLLYDDDNFVVVDTATSTLSALAPHFNSSGGLGHPVMLRDASGELLVSNGHLIRFNAGEAQWQRISRSPNPHLLWATRWDGRALALTYDTVGELNALGHVSVAGCSGDCDSVVWGSGLHDLSDGALWLRDGDRFWMFDGEEVSDLGRLPQRADGLLLVDGRLFGTLSDGRIVSWAPGDEGMYDHEQSVDASFACRMSDGLLMLGGSAYVYRK